LFRAKWMQRGHDTHHMNGIMVKNSYKATRRISDRNLSIRHEMLKKSS
jgi:hypothetical protein